VVETGGRGAAEGGRGGAAEGEETRERRENAGASGGWFAATPGLRDGEGLLHFAAGAEVILSPK
jgi:hypothetical protein